jgi:hypothetical protein
MSPSGKISAARELEIYDILQMGVDYTAGANLNEPLPPHFRAPQFLVLIGTIVKEKNLEKRRGSVNNSSSPLALKQNKLDKLRSRALVVVQAPEFSTKSGSFRLYFEFGDFVGETTSGYGIFVSKEIGSYSLVYNNFQVSWLVGMTNVEGETRTTFLLEQKKGNYRISADGDRIGKIIFTKGNNRLILLPKNFSGKTGAAIGTLERSLFIYAPPQFLVCSPSRDIPPSPTSLPSPVLSLSSEPPQTIDNQETGSFYCLSEEDNGKIQILSKDNSRRRTALIGESIIVKEEKAGWAGKQRIWIDGRLSNVKGNEPLIILSLALRVLDKAIII